MKSHKESLGAWIFQANRKYYRFCDLIQDGNFNKEWWHIANHLTKIQNETKKGNIVLFWLTDKHANSKDAGIYAIGEIISGPKTLAPEDCVIDYCTSEYYKRFPDGNFSCLHFQCRLIKEFIKKPILKQHLRINQILKNLTVIKAPQPANFRVTKEQWQELQRLYPELLQ